MSTKETRDPLTDARIAEIKARNAARTPGPWQQATHVGEPRALVAAAAPRRSLLGLDRDGMAIVDRAADAAFIAHAPEDIDALVAEVERMHALLAGAGVETLTVLGTGVAVSVIEAEPTACMKAGVVCVSADGVCVRCGTSIRDLLEIDT